MTEEYVLVIPTEKFHELGHFQGFNEDHQTYYNMLFTGGHQQYLPRSKMEEDPSFKQLIPYCILRYENQIFNYERGTAQGESRLHSQRSIGIGGHISTVDLIEGKSPYVIGMQRELTEEIEYNDIYYTDCIGLINDDESEVGKVHLGVVHEIKLASPTAKPREASMLNAGFMDLDVLFTEIDQFEPWSQFCLQYLKERT